MRVMLLAAAASLAAIAVPAGPASAQDWSGHDRSRSDRPSGERFDGVRFVGGDSNRFLGCDVRDRRDRRRRGDDDDGDRRRGRDRGGFCDVSVGTFVDAGEWARWNNRSWESDSYNDWWHDRPDRAYPRWVTRNKNCERMWWSGGGWRC